MIWLYSLIFIFLIIFCYLLFAPFYLEINSERNIYRIRFHKLASAAILREESSLKMEVKIAGWHKVLDLFEPHPKSATGAKPKEKKKVSKQPGKNKMRVPIRKMIGVVKSFKVNKCTFIVDFGDMAIDGILYPVFYWMGRWSKKNISVNFMGENRVEIEIENNLMRILWAYIKS